MELPWRGFRSVDGLKKKKIPHAEGNQIGKFATFHTLKGADRKGGGRDLTREKIWNSQLHRGIENLMEPDSPDQKKNGSQRKNRKGLSQEEKEAP